MAACLSSASASALAETRFDEAGELVQRTRAFKTREAVLRKVQVGAGKSSEAIRYIADLLSDDPTLRICFVVPTINLAKQVTTLLEVASDRKWLLYRGMDGKESGEPLCGFDGAASAAQRAGVDPYTTICTGCPLKQSCLLWAQYESRSNIVVTTHAMLRLGLKPYDERPVFDLLIIDEDPTSKLLATETHTLSHANLVQYCGKYASTLEAVVQGVTEAAKKGRRLRFQDLPFPHAIHRLIEALKPPKVEISRDGPIDEDRVALAEARNKVRRMLCDLLDSMAMSPGFDAEIAGCAPHLNEETGAIILNVTTARDIHSQFAECETVVVLSATAQYELLKRPIPHLDLDEQLWRPYEHGKFVFVDGAKSSRTALLKNGKLTAGGLEALRVIETLARRCGNILLVCQMLVSKALEAAGLPDNVASAHFNALEGLNQHAQVDAIIILGRPLPTMQGTLPLAEAVAGICLAASLGSREWRNALFAPRRARMHTANDGKPYTTRDYIHPNPHVNAALRSITYGAVAQADRSRGQHRTPDNPVVIYDATGIDNVWQIDEVVRWRSLCGWFGEMEAKGFIPHPDAAHGLNELLAAVLPGLFPDAATAKDHRKEDKKAHGVTLETLVADCPFRDGVVVDIKLPGARYGVPVIVNADTAPDASALIQKHLPEGTKISTKARHTMRLDQPKLKETGEDCITYEIATGPCELAAEEKAAGAPHGSNNGAQELVRSDDAIVPLRPGTG